VVTRLFGMDGMGWDKDFALVCHSRSFYPYAVPFGLASGNGSLRIGGW
jgi:hypothetical protein